MNSEKKKASSADDAEHKNHMTDSVQSCAECQSCHKGDVVSTLLATAAGAILILLAVTHLHYVSQLVAFTAGANLLNGGAK